MQNFRLAGRLQYFLKNWEKLTNDAFILELDSISIRTIPNGTSHLNFNESGGNCYSGPGNSGNVEKRCNKISPTQHKNLVSKFNIYSPKKDLANRPVVNLKKLNKHIPYNNFKMEGLFS